MTKKTVPFNPHFGVFVIETLTLGMYGESRNAIREYVQNSFDSLRQAVRDGLVDEDAVRVDVVMDSNKDWLTIRDNGIGLSVENAVDVLASVGASNKDYRKTAGFRGIGRLAGIVFCDRLTFQTKSAGEKQKTVVTFLAKELREKLAPDSQETGDAAATLASCVEATVEEVDDEADHFFEVSLVGFYNPPAECMDVAKLKSFLSQVSPLPYAPAFPHSLEIRSRPENAIVPIEQIRLFVRDGDEESEELFKPYGANFSVKRERVPLSEIQFVLSPTKSWWGWIGLKDVSGTIKDQDSRGIRVRVRNIQIDDTKILRDIFAVSNLGGKPRSSYARFADWYVGEIFVNPRSAIPNARRDGFEETNDWHTLRDEFDKSVATPFGKLAYKTSKSDQLSLDSLGKRLTDLSKGATRLIQSRSTNWDRVSLSMTEANELQRRIALAVRNADDDELPTLRELSESTSSIKAELDTLVATAPATTKDCEEEVAQALSSMIQKLYKELKRKLAPAEWTKCRDIIQRVSGEEPK